MNRQELDRLNVEQQRALFQTNQQSEKWCTFRSDYVALQNKLKELPNSVTHDVMVPFGPFAFMPGQLIHTNEILVLLGDNWFAEKSAKEACEVIDRRLKDIDKNIDQLNMQKQLLESRFHFTKEAIQDISGSGGVTELQEEYDSDEEKRWREEHRKKMRRHKEAERQQKSLTDRDVFSRLEELELQEKIGREMLSNTSEETSDVAANLWKPESKHLFESSKENPYEKKAVHWKDEMQLHLPLDKIEEESEDTQSSLDSDDSDTVSTNVIYFQHSPREENSNASLLHLCDERIESPGDIYRLYCKPKSILKQTSHKAQPTNVDFLAEKKNELRPQPMSTTAVCDHVQERTITTADPTHPVSQTNPPTKKVSKFRAMRMQQKQ